jgi:hypothetical protein
MAKPDPKLVEKTLYAMHRAAAVTIERFDESLYLVEEIDLDLLVMTKDLIADLYQLQVGIGISVDFYGRDLARSRQAST